MSRLPLILACLIVVGAVAFGVFGRGSAAHSACAPSKQQTSAPLPSLGQYPLSVSLEPLRLGSNGGVTYRIALSNTSPRLVPWACLTIVQFTRGSTGSSSNPTPEQVNGTIRGPAALRESSGSAGPTYRLLVRTPQSGSAVTRIVATPAHVPGTTVQTCVVVSAQPAGASANSTLEDSLQAICTFPGKEPARLLPIAIRLSGPTEALTRGLTKYTVSVRNLDATPVHDIGLGIAQVDMQAKRRHFSDPVLTDWGLRHGRRLRNDIRLTTLGAEPVTFHIWWHAHAIEQNGQSAMFAIEAYDRSTYPNPRELVTTELASPLTTG